MIYTITPNILWEETFFLSAPWKEGKTHRAEKRSAQVGGKGLNVARMLERLKSPHEAVAFTGGEYREPIENWLRHQKFRSRCFTHPQTYARPGVVVRSEGQAETTFFGPNSSVHSESIKEAAAYLANLSEPSTIALCGSVPNWEKSDWEPLRECFRTTSGHHLWVIDTYGPALTWFASQKVDLIKVNADEWQAIEQSGTSCQSRAAIITDGSQSLSGWSGEGPRWNFAPPKIPKQISPTGSGDVFLAALLHFWQPAQGNLETAAREAARYGAANAAHPG
ncbi:MAG: PfkB family carbohydrate kinase, partial [Opitutales bacterium]|nr:PfkB family carbohydrate kinase [Opitutales bacterium]